MARWYFCQRQWQFSLSNFIQLGEVFPLPRTAVNEMTIRQAPHVGRAECVAKEGNKEKGKKKNRRDRKEKEKN